MISFVALLPAFNSPLASRIVSPSAASSVTMNAAQSRRALLQTAASVALGLPLAAQADGANSAATVARAKGIYGSRIAKLAGKDAAAVAAEENAFTLYLSGAFRAPISGDAKVKKAELTALSKTILKAAKAGDSAGAQAGLKTFIATAKIDDQYNLAEGVWNPTQRRNAGAPTTDTVMGQSASYGFAFYQPTPGDTPGFKAKDYGLK